jgi:glycyl-tRNA synthetase alpha chain
MDLDLVPAEITYGLERIVAFLQNVESVYDIEWAPGFKYADVRLADEQQFSVYNFEMADVLALGELFEMHHKEGARLLAAFQESPDKLRFPLLAAYDQVLKCSHIFNMLDSRGVLSVTERANVIGLVRQLAVSVAKAWVAQQTPQSEAAA